jgi:hypothetical protein
MPLLENDIPFIEKYLAGSLSKSEATQFQERLTDIDFKNELQAHKTALLAVKSEGRKNLKAQFQQWDKNITSNKTQVEKEAKPKNNLWKLLIGLLLVSLLGVSIYYFLNKEKPVVIDKSLYAANFEAYPNVIAPLQKGAPEEDAYKKAFQSYELKKYKEAENALAKLDQNDEAVQFYRALNFMANKNYAQASITLSKVIQNKNHRFLQPAQWYSALIAIQDQKMNQAKNMLTTIGNQSGHQYQKKAKSLLEEIK